MANSLTINGGTLNIAAGHRADLPITVNMTGGVISASGPGETDNLNYNFFSQLNATSDAAGNPARITAPKVALADIPLFNVTRGPATPASDVTISWALVPCPWSPGTGLTMTGTGVLRLSGANTYTGHHNGRGHREPHWCWPLPAWGPVLSGPGGTGPSRPAVCGSTTAAAAIRRGPSSRSWQACNGGSPLPHRADPRHGGQSRHRLGLDRPAGLGDGGRQADPLRRRQPGRPGQC